MGANCLGYDEETKTALLAVTSWGQVMADGLTGSEVRLSPIGLSVIFKEDGSWTDLAGCDVSVKTKDGSVDALWRGGQGSFGTYGTESSRKVLVWNFREPVEPEDIEGVYIGEDYYPVK